MIYKIVRKSMYKKFGLLISIFILVVLSSMFMGISNFTYDTLSDSYATMTEEGNVEDFRLYKIGQLVENDEIYSDDFVDELENDYDVTLEEKSYYIYNPRTEDGIKTGITKYDETDTMNKPVLDEGEFPVNENEILVQPQVLKYFEKNIGDVVTIDDVDYTISGTAYFQEFIYPMDIFFSGNFVTNLDAYFPIYMNATSFDNLDSSEAKYENHTYYSGTFNDESMTATEKNDEVLSVLSGPDSEITVEIPEFDELGNPVLDENFQPVMQEIPAFIYGIPKDYNVSVSAVDQEVASSKTMFTFLAQILTLMTIALAIILVNSIFKAQRREMGILKAEGVSIGKLTVGFAGFITIFITFATLIGSLLARFTLSPLLLYLYKDQFYIKYYDIPKEAYVAVIITSIITIVIIVILVTLLSIRRNLNQKTLLLIKNIDRQSNPRGNFTKIFKWLKFTRRYQLNILFRNFGKSVLLFFGVFIASFLILMAMILYGGINDIVNGTIGTTYDYKTEVTFNPQSDFEYDSKSSVVATTFTIDSVSNPEYEFDNSTTDTDSASVTAFDFEDNNYINIIDKETDERVKSSGGIVITQSFSEKYMVDVGDTITVNDFTDTSDEPEKITLTIDAITESFFLPYIFMDINDLHETFDTPDDYHNTLVSNEELTNEYYEEITEKDSTASIEEITDFQAQIESQLGTIQGVIAIISFFAAVIGFIALSSISSVIIDSNRKTISVMKVLGYTVNEVGRMTIGIYKWFVIIIYIACIPLIKYLITKVVQVAFGDADFTIPINFNILYLGVGLIIIFVTYLISSKMAQRKVNKIKLAESLKADE